MTSSSSEPAFRAGKRSPALPDSLSFAGEPAGKRLYPLVRELAADGIPVAVLLRVLKLSSATFHRWLRRRLAGGELVQAYRANALFDAHADDPGDGHHFLCDEAAQAGEMMCERAGWRICRGNRWWSTFGKKRGAAGIVPGPPMPDDRVHHDFTAIQSNESWLTDSSEYPTAETKLYLCAVKDVFSDRIVGRPTDGVSHRVERAADSGRTPR